MTMTFTRLALFAGSCTLLAACANNPNAADGQTQVRPVVGEATTGSNIPRRDGKSGVSPVVQSSPEAMKEALNKVPTPMSRTGQP